MKTFNETYTADLNAAGVATLTTEAIDLAHMAGYSVHARWTKVSGTVGGTFKTQKSNDGSYWIEVASQVIGDATGAKDYEVPDVFYRYFRTVTNLTGGVAGVNIIVNSKGV